MADIFPGVHTLRRFLTKNAVRHNTSGTNWLLCVESDLKTVQDLMANLSAHQVIGGNEAAMEYCVYSARRYEQTMVYVLLKWECTFSQLEMAFGEGSGLLGRLIKEHCFYALKDFLLGAKGTSIGEWSTFFSAEEVEFSQELLNVFAIELKIGSTAMLVVLYHDLFKLFDKELCHRLGMSFTEEDADRLYRDHYRNSIAFRRHNHQLCLVNTAVEMKKCIVDYVDYMFETQ